MHTRPFVFFALLVMFMFSGLAVAQVDASAKQSPVVTTSAPATTVTLTILAKGSRIPLGKAEVRCGDETVFSDPSGLASITLPPSGDGVVTVTRVGYEKLVVKYAVLRGHDKYTVRLYPGKPDDNVVLVQGHRNNSVSRTTVSIDEASKVAPGGDPAQVVKLLPGVQTGGGGRGGGGGGDVVVQGSGPHDSRYYIDDLEVPFIFHGFADLSVIPGDMLRSVDFDSAGFGVEYGNATGGIITLHTKEEIPERAQTAFVLNLPFYSGVLYTAPLSESSSITVGIRRSYIDFFLKEYLDRRNRRNKDKSTQVTLAPYFSDAEAQYLKKVDDGHDKVTFLGAYDGMKAVVPANFASGTSGLADINFYTAFADLGWERERRLDAHWKYVTTPQLYYYETVATLGDTLNADQSVQQIRVPTHVTRRLSKDENLYLGVDPDVTLAATSLYAPQFRRDDPTFDPEDAPSIKTVEKDQYANLAAWAAVDVKLGEMIVTPGVRTYFDGETKKSTTDPRIKARYGLSEVHSLKAGVGQYSESPTANQASAKRGNPHLDFIVSDHYVVGLESAWNDTWSTDFSVYYKTARGLIRSDNVANYANKGFMHTRGFETLIRRNQTGRLFGWLSYTYSKSEEKQEATSPWRTATYDQTHVLTAVGDYKFTGTWDVGARYAYHTGSTYDTVSGSVFNANLDKYESRSGDSDINNGRLPPYNSLTAYFNHDFLYDSWKLGLRFGVEQYWFRPQVSQVSYNDNYSKTEKVTTLTTVPFLELKGVM